MRSLVLVFTLLWFHQMLTDTLYVIISKNQVIRLVDSKVILLDLFDSCPLVPRLLLACLIGSNTLIRFNFHEILSHPFHAQYTFKYTVHPMIQA